MNFRCSNGRCILLTWLCDGESDCPNNEDEGKACLKNITCDNSTRFHCKNGK